MVDSVWPDNNQCCVCLTFDVDAEWVFMGNKPHVVRMPRMFSQGEYEWRANTIPRILDVLGEHGLKATFFVVGMNAVNHPEIMKMICEHGHELAVHGLRHEDVSDLPKKEERGRILESRKAIEDASGFKPVGNRTAGGELSLNTLDILAEEGFLYDSSLRGSDLPYRLENGLVIVPSYYEMDDFHLFADYPGTAYHARMMSPQTGFEIWTNAFDGYYKYGLCYTTMFHPQIIGKPGGLMLFERLLNYIERFPRVWFATAEEVARRWIEVCGG